MCGIYCFFSNEVQSLDIILNKMEFLEYRGYDSVGIFYNNKVVKTKGNTNVLRKYIKNNEYTCSSMCHTRWATHGIPNNINAHPHQSLNGRYTMVMNGIVENCKELRKSIWNYLLKGETDTEVLVNYIEYFKKHFNMLSMKEVLSTMSLLVSGSLSFVLHDNEEPDMYYIFTRDTPIIVGISKNQIEITSDINALNENTKKYIDIPNKCICRVSLKYGLEIFDGYCLARIVPQLKEFQIGSYNISKNNYDHYMIKEIMEIPNHRNIEASSLPEPKTFQQIIIGACGSSYYAALYASQLIENKLNILVKPVLASEYNHIDPTTPTLYIFISQSGETADTLGMARKVLETSHQTMAICNVKDSTLSRLVKSTIYMNVGPEVGVASTKTFTGQLMAFNVLVAKMLGETTDYLDELHDDLITYIENTKEEIKSIAELYYQSPSLLIMGRNYNYPISLEAALKIKEIDYIHAEGFSASEMKHGVIALVEPTLPIFYINCHENKNNYEELKARNALLIKVNETIHNKEHPELDAFFNVIYFQLLSYYMGVFAGHSIDKPRNLAKSVTVT